MPLPASLATRGAVRRLVRRGALLLLFISSLAAGTLLLFSSRLARDAAGPALINLAGRQRMLTSYITQLTMVPLVSGAELPSDSLLPQRRAAALAAQDSVHRELMLVSEELKRRGMPGAGVAMTAVDPLLSEFQRTVRAVETASLSAPRENQPTDELERALRQLRGADIRLREGYEQVVAAFEEAFTSELAATERQTLQSVVFGAVVLLALAAGLLWPSVAELRETLAMQESLQAELARREAVMRTLAVAAPVGFFRTDAAGLCIFVNDTYSALSGLTLEQSKGAGWRACIHSDDLARVTTTWMAAAASGGEFRSEHRFRRPDGEVHEVLVQAAPIRLPDGTLEGYVGTVVDQTERNELMRDLGTSLSFQQALVTGNAYAVIATRTDGTIVQMNPAAEALLGYREAELSGRATPGIFHEPSEVVRCAIELSERLGRTVTPGFEVFAELATSVEPAEREWTYIRKDGTRVPVRLALSSITTAAGHQVGYLGVARDLRAERAREAERQQQLEAVRTAEQKALEATRMKSAFVANMSHEIRTPMNAIIGFTDLVLEHTAVDELQRDSLQTVRNAATHLLDLVNDILDFSKIEAGQMRVERIEFDVRDVVTDVATLLRPRAVAQSLTLGVDIAANIGERQYGDPVRVRQILMNFAGNALKFTQQGRVDLRVVRSGATTLRLEVVDSGIGMRADVIGRVFEQFAQADDSTTRKFGGTGLGLAIVKELAELMGGCVGVASVEGRGSTFWCELPLLAEPEMPRLMA